MFEIAGGILIAVAVLAVLKRLPRWVERRREKAFDRAWKRHVDYTNRISADPEAKKLLLDDADWLSSVPKKDE